MELLGDLEVLLERHRRAVPHVALEQRVLAVLDALGESASSGRTKPSSLSWGQWSVCSAMLTGYFLATSRAYAAKATEPVTMSLTVGPERYSAPPVEIWMMPSLPASAKPASAALSVCEEETLMAGNANACAFAVSSISAYFSGVAMGIGGLLGSGAAGCQRA